MEQIKGILIDEDLFSENLDSYSSMELEYINAPDAIGIATEYKNNQKKYIIYMNNETGSSIYEKTTNSFTKAVIFAREIYEGLKAYYDKMNKKTK